MTTYRRNFRGTTVHLTGCHYATDRKAKDWNWAEGKEPYDIDVECLSRGIRLHWCKKCFPGVQS